MKKIFIFLVLIVAIGAKSQTFEETKAATEKEIATLKSEVEKINHQLYYLEVELPAKIDGDSLLANNYSEKKYLLQKNNQVDLKKEYYFSKEKITRLKSDKKRMEQEVERLNNVLSTAQGNKLSTDFIEDYPETMSVYEYRRRNRALNYKIGDKIAEKSLSGNSLESEYGVGLPGILFNDKLGQGEIATFTIVNKHHPEFGFVGGTPQTLNPQQKIKVNLMPGTYFITISCGYFNQVHEVSVDPKKIKGFLGEPCYFFAAKWRNNF
jgi:hypothetical protein